MNNETTVKEKFTTEEVQISKKRAIETLLLLLQNGVPQVKLDAAKLLLDYRL